MAQSEELRIRWVCETVPRAAKGVVRDLLPNIDEVRVGDESKWLASDFPVVFHVMAHQPWPATVIGGDSDLSLQWDSHGYRVVAHINWSSADREDGSIELTATAITAMPKDRPPIRATGICRRFRHQQDLQASQ